MFLWKKRVREPSRFVLCVRVLRQVRRLSATLPRVSTSGMPQPTKTVPILYLRCTRSASRDTWVRAQTRTARPSAWPVSVPRVAWPERFSLLDSFPRTRPVAFSDGLWKRQKHVHAIRRYDEIQHNFSLLITPNRCCVAATARSVTRREMRPKAMYKSKVNLRRLHQPSFLFGFFKCVCFRIDRHDLGHRS